MYSPPFGAFNAFDDTPLLATGEFVFFEEGIKGREKIDPFGLQDFGENYIEWSSGGPV